MKQVAFYALTTALVISTGCSDNKKETEGVPVETAPTASLTDQAKSVTKDLTQKAEALTEQATEKLTAVTDQAQSVIKNFTVSKEEVLAEINLPIADLKTKVETLAQPELLAYANTYKDVLLEKKDQLASLTSQLKGLPMSELLGAKGKAIKNQISQYTSQFTGLKERYDVYLDKLKSLGVDLSAFGI